MMIIARMDVSEKRRLCLCKCFADRPFLRRDVCNQSAGNPVLCIFWTRPYCPMFPGKYVVPVPWIRLPPFTECRCEGAPAIGVAAAFGMALAAGNFFSDSVSAGDAEQVLRDAGTILKAARPTAVNLAWAVQRMLSTAENIDFPHAQLADTLEKEALGSWPKIFRLIC
jgi:hypothetical protein